MASYTINMYTLTCNLAERIQQLGRALNRTEMHHFVTDEIAKQYPNILMGDLMQVRTIVLEQLNKSNINRPINADFGYAHIKTDWAREGSSKPLTDEYIVDGQGNKYHIPNMDWAQYNANNANNPFANSYGAKAFNERMHRQYTQGQWGSDMGSNNEGAVDFDEEDLIDAFSYKGNIWQAPKTWRDYRESKGDFMGGFTRIPAGARINTRLFEALPFEMIKN